MTATELTRRLSNGNTSGLEIHGPTRALCWSGSSDFVSSLASSLHRVDGGSLGSIRDMLFNFIKLQENHDNERRPVSQVEFEVCELLNFMWQATNADPILTRHISTGVVSKAIERAGGLGICRNRLWNLAIASGDEKHLAILMQLTNNNNGDTKAKVSDDKRFRQQPKHESCSAESCVFNNVDSTNVRQLHKCPTKDCGLLEFPLDNMLLETSREPYTWWIDHSNRPYLTQEADYVAVSHVWSDGTGAGIQKDGYVNSCLFNYFKEVATELGCKAIWWDTISLPRKGESRKRAIGRINQDFLSAKCTVIHDQYLVNFPWAEDGTPCLALALSSWFTRAWTALELLYSTDVRVIFRHPSDPDKKVIKKLDTEVILDGSLCSRGHFLASRLIDDLRHQKLNTVSSILEVLKTRCTSKPHDMIIIAGLLVGQKPDTSRVDMTAELSRNILRALQTIESSFLFHSHATITDVGGFSWCPFNLLQGPDPSTLYNRDASAVVDANGAISAAFLYRVFQRDDVRKITAYSSHKSVENKISTALESPETCLLLWQRSSDFSRALLVQAVDVGTFELPRFGLQLIDCHYVGTVNVELKPSDARIILVRIGHVKCPPEKGAGHIMNRYFKQPHFTHVIIANTRETVLPEEEKILSTLLTVDIDYVYAELQAFFTLNPFPWWFSLSRLKHTAMTVIAFLLINYRSYNQSISTYEESMKKAHLVPGELKKIDGYIKERHDKMTQLQRVVDDIRIMMSKLQAKKAGMQSLKTELQDLLAQVQQQIIETSQRVKLYEGSPTLLLQMDSGLPQEVLQQLAAGPETGSPSQKGAQSNIQADIIPLATDDAGFQINRGKELQRLYAEDLHSDNTEYESKLDFLSEIFREAETLHQYKNEAESKLQKLCEGEVNYQNSIDHLQNMLLQLEHHHPRYEAEFAEFRHFRKEIGDIYQGQLDLHKIELQAQNDNEVTRARLAILEDLLSEGAISGIDGQENSYKERDGTFLPAQTVFGTVGHTVSSVALGLLSFFGTSIGEEDDDASDLIY
ncbi:hypothetical protein UA08_04794 [Talaromyces atroroseus]|uniref:Heterokaryon incompatibility domain-containing protein n=1 Tax=Talaromyces atroroseus TaxID=1441469 RepID=A0A225B328_TALAT|nr:hypothetical protein UA08_04794 [Talaromyces atroroseus]OKL60257.1 hypothetical protein UA08_04794 [Talaromyces atroroseus]